MGSKNYYINHSNEDEDIFIALLVLQCAAKSPNKEEFQRMLDIMREILGISRNINVNKVLDLLSKRYLINKPHTPYIHVEKLGKELLSNSMGTQYSLIQSRLKDTLTDYEGTKAMLCKFLVEKMPSDLRRTYLNKIIVFLQIYYKEICWHYAFSDKEVFVPFHELEKAFDYEVKCEMLVDDFSLHKSDLEKNIFHSYLKYFEGRNKQGEGEVKDGSIYRLLSWYVNQSRKEIVLSVAADQGYFVFQSTCGVIRNEIEKNISDFNGDIDSFALILKHRE